MNSRTDIEVAIIGACVLERYAYPLVMDFLTYKNFSTPNIQEGIYADHQKMFRAFEEMYPNKPIELRSVAHHIKNNEMMYWFVQYQSMVSSSANLRYWAAVLLELNFKDAFFTLSQKVKDVHSNTVSTTVAALMEIENEMYDGDILEILPEAVAHLREIGADEDTVNGFATLQQNVELKMKKINQQARIDALINNLSNIEGMVLDTPSRMCLHNLTNAIKEIISTGKISQQKQDLIFSL